MGLMIKSLSMRLFLRLLIILSLMSSGLGMKLSHRKVDPVLFPINVGTPSQTIYTSLTFESSSTFFIGNSSICESNYQNETTQIDKNLYCTSYNLDNSTTGTVQHNEGVYNKITNDESVAYYKASDNISIGGLEWPNNFNVVSSGNISTSTLSIAPPNSDVDNEVTFSESLFQKGKSKFNSVAIWLGDDDFTGTITFGGIYRSLVKKNKTKEFSFTYFTQDNSTNQLIIPVSLFTLQTNDQYYETNISGRGMSFRDTNYFYFPDYILNVILSSYELNTPDKNGEYIVDCEKARSMPGSFILHFQGETRFVKKQIEIPLNTFYVHPYYNDICALPIGSTSDFDDFEEHGIIIGLYAAHWYYLVFDYTSSSFSFAPVVIATQTIHNNFILLKDNWNRESDDILFLVMILLIPVWLMFFILLCLLLSSFIDFIIKKRKSSPIKPINVQTAFKMMKVDIPIERPIPEILNNSLAAITVPQHAQCIQDRDNNVGFNSDLEGGVEMETFDP